ncbi:MAG: excinuclease ABC subunit UvrA [Deltaproteobacteria bacterium]|nr:excinuclease ABC subunit UvrA [Deltaproteobacteria bacterium]
MIESGAGNSIVIKGARVHNLKAIDLDIPRDKLVVITGVSGSGKSSLAFDTVYAEGQRRYVESLSVYARQFLDQMDKPDVESIEGLSPAISIEQKTTSKNPRSTVGTVTEVYDYLRLLYARIGRPFCYNCGSAITSQTIQQMCDRALELPAGSKLTLLSPIVRGRKGEYKKELEALRKDGYTKVRINGEVADLNDAITGIDKRKKHDIEVVVDRLVVKDGIGRRLADSLEVASRLSGGMVMAESDSKTLLFNEKLSCVKCSVSYPEITPAAFSFNSPHGACPECKGLGEKFIFDPALVVSDEALSLRDGAIAPWGRGGGKSGKSAGLWYLSILEGLASHYGFSTAAPYKKLPKEIKDIILNGSNGVEIEFRHEGGRSKYTYTETFEGVIRNIERRYHETASEDVRADLEEYMDSQPCPSCKGARLKKEALFIKVNGASISEVAGMPIKDALRFFNALRLTPYEEEIAKRIMKELKERLGFLVNVGLDYLTLERASATLSGGEGQRIRLATQIGSSLVGVLYVLDEPSIGLHQRDNKRLLSTLKRLRDMGNTILVVEHDAETIREADYIIDMGPGAGEHGGQVVATGTAAEIEAAESLTGKYLSGALQIPVPAVRMKPDKRFLTLKGLKANNLKDITVKIPVGLITCVTGVSGSGKSTLVIDTLYRSLAKRLYDSKVKPGEFASITGFEFFDKVIDIDQSPIGRTPRSNPATYTGVFTPIRELFSQIPESKVRGYEPGRFSFNIKGGRCEACAGDGLIKVEMHFLPDVYVLCDVCKGARYGRETLEVRYKGKNISDCLDMPVTEALSFFENIPAIKEKLKTLSEVGLGYIKLGQSSTTLSGGEAQRIKLSRELSKRATGRTIYILDEPTTGLHFADIHHLLDVLINLRDAGNTIVIIEHNLDVIKCADFIIDLGPEGGGAGGRVVATGTPEEVAGVCASYTGRFLKEALFGAGLRGKA